MLALALAVTAGLTGISKDFQHYRVGKKHVCALATADAGDGTVMYGGDECEDVPPARQAAFGFSLPRAPARPRLPDGREVLARVTLDDPPALAAPGPVSCLTLAGEPCPSAEEMRFIESITPRWADLVIVARAADGAETVLARTRGTMRQVRQVRVSPDGRALLVVFTYEKRFRDAPREAPIGVEVLGVDVSARLR